LLHLVSGGFSTHRSAKLKRAVILLLIFIITITCWQTCQGEQNGCCLRRLSVGMSLEKGHRSAALSRRDPGRAPRGEPGAAVDGGCSGRATAGGSSFENRQSLGILGLGRFFYILATEQNSSICKNPWQKWAVTCSALPSKGSACLLTKPRLRWVG